MTAFQTASKLVSFLTCMIFEHRSILSLVLPLVSRVAFYPPHCLIVMADYEENHTTLHKTYPPAYELRKTLPERGWKMSETTKNG